MQKITIEIADNGVIKNIIDDNINAGGQEFHSVVVYDFDEGPKNKLIFLNELCMDIGLDLGNSKSKNQIKITEGWGDNYIPTKNEVENKIKELQKYLAD